MSFAPLSARWRSNRRPLPPAMRIVIGLVVLVAIGTLALMLPGVGVERRLTFREAIFTATSALCVTGLSLILPGRDLTLFGQIILLIQIQVGGIGFMVLAVTLFSMIGRRISLLSRLALTDSLGLAEPRAILRLTRQVLVWVGMIELIGAILLWLVWRNKLGDQRAAFYGLFHAVSAFCNAGFDLFSGLPAFPQGLPNDTATLLILAVLIVLGGLGIPVFAEIGLALRTRNPDFSLHTRVTLVTVVALIAIGWLALWLAEQKAGGIWAQEPLGRQLMLALFHSVSARTAGFVGIPSFADLTPASQLTMIALMFIGSAPASMGGGITTGTFAVLILALWSYARGHQTALIGERSLPVGTVRRASAVLTVSLLVVISATWLLLVTHNATLDDALFEVVSAFATCGLTLAFTSELNPFGQAIIILMMFWGRLGALTLIIALAQRPAVYPVHYPEEHVLIG